MTVAGFPTLPIPQIAGAYQLVSPVIVLLGVDEVLPSSLIAGIDFKELNDEIRPGPRSMDAVW